MVEWMRPLFLFFSGDIPAQLLVLGQQRRMRPLLQGVKDVFIEISHADVRLVSVDAEG